MKYISKFLIVLLLFFLVGCNQKEIVEIRFLETDLEYQINVNHITDYDILIIYDDQSTKLISLEEFMISDEDISLFNTTGDFSIDFVYEGFSFTGDFKVYEREIDKVLLSVYYQAVLETDLDLTYEEWLESIAGADGVDGKEIILDVVDGFVVWKYSTDTSWTNLFEIGLTNIEDMLVVDIYYQDGELIVEYSDESNITIEILQNFYLVNFYNMDGFIINSQIVYEGEDATPPLFDQGGYIFIEWDTTYTNVTSSLNIHPICDVNTFTITFESNGGTSVSLIENINYGDTVLLPNTEKEGSIFLGWYLDINNPSSLVTSDTLIYQDLTLYAKWEIQIYEVTFITNTDIPLQSQEITYGDSLEFLPELTSNDAFFQGWYLDLECNTIFDLTTMPAYDITLYAKWVHLVLSPDDEINPSYYTITDYLDDYNHIDIPSTYKGIPITVIGSTAFPEASFYTITIPDSITTISPGAFNSAYNLETLVIPDSVTYIGMHAFLYNQNLTSITLSSNITEISYGSFESTFALTSIIIPEGVTTIGEGAFSESGITSISLPSTLLSIQRQAFFDSNLETITIPEGVNLLGDGAFEECEFLREVNLPSTLTSIGNYVFNFTPSLININVNSNNPVYSSIDGILFSNTNTKLEMVPPKNETTELFLPANITEIDSYAFRNAENLIIIIIPDSINITSNYFTEVPNLKEIISYPSLGPETYTSSIDGVLYNLDQTTLIKYPNAKSDTTFTLPSTVTTISNSAFAYNKYLEEIIFNTVLTTIEAHAFHEAQNITNISLPNSVTTLERNVFSNMPNLTTLTLSSSLTVIPMSMLYETPNVSNIVIPFTVETIDSYAFKGVTALTTITIGLNVNSIYYNAFDDCINLESINVDIANTTYASVDGVLYNKDITTLHIYPIGKSNTTFTIPNTVTYIDTYAFFENKYMQYMIIPGSVETIGLSAFYYMESIIQVTIELDIITPHVITMEFYAFTNLATIPQIVVPASLYNDYINAEYWSYYQSYIVPLT